MANWHQEDYHELPEFLRFNKYGGVLTPGKSAFVLFHRLNASVQYKVSTI